MFSGAQVPFLTLDGDAANIASMAAAHDHPERFKLDPVFGGNSGIAYYRSDLLLVLRAMRKYFGDYGTILALLVVPLLAIQIIGNYFLGSLLLKDHTASVVLSILLLIPISLPGGEYWGLYPQAVPRNVFGAFLPWLLVLLILLQNRPAMWFVPTILLALMMRIHQLSGIAWALIVLILFLICYPRQWETRKKIQLVVLLSAALLIISSEPYLAFLQNSILSLPYPGSNPALSTTRKFFAAFESPVRFLGETAFACSPFLLCSLAVFWTQTFRHNNELRRLTWSWLLGVMLIAVVFPAAEYKIAGIFGFTPLEKNFARNCRFLIPLAILLSTVVLVDLTRLLTQRTKFLRRAFVLPVLALVLVLFTVDKLWLRVAIGKQENDILTREVGSRTDDFELLNWIRLNTNDSAVFMPLIKEFMIGQAIRYYALRPLAFSPRDVAHLAYSSSRHTERTLRLVEMSFDFTFRRLPAKELQSVFNSLLAETHADYVVINSSASEDVTGSFPIVYSNQTYSVLQTNPILNQQ